MTEENQVNSGQRCQFIWNVISVIFIVITLMHFFSSGPLKGSVAVIDKAAAEQFLEDEESSTVELEPTKPNEKADVVLNSVKSGGPKPSLKTLNEVDAMHLAVSLGRLDFASIGLTVIGVVLAVFGLMGFLKIDRETKTIAKDVARNEARSEAKLQAKSAALAFMKTEEFINQVDELVKKEVADRTPKEVQRYLDKRLELDIRGISDSDTEGFIPSDDESSDGGNRGGQ